jgi:hypothetical protein
MFQVPVEEDFPDELPEEEEAERMVSSGMLRCVAFVGTDVSEELSASFIWVARIGELGTTLAVTSNRRTLQRNTLGERDL